MGNCGTIAPISSKSVGPKQRTAHPYGGDPLNPADQRDAEIATLRERLSRLSQASRRITEDLDLDAVLQRVVDGARLLTGAGRGGLTVIDDTAQLEGFISSGLTEEAHRGFVELPGGLDLFAYLSNLPEPLRVADFRGLRPGVGAAGNRPAPGTLDQLPQRPHPSPERAGRQPLPVGQAG